MASSTPESPEKDILDRENGFKKILPGIVAFAGFRRYCEIH
jgi:hypothetical protein